MSKKRRMKSAPPHYRPMTWPGISNSMQPTQSQLHNKR